MCLCKAGRNHVKKDTIKDHLVSAKHAKSARMHEGCRPATQQPVRKSLDLREDFCLDIVRAMTMVDIPLCRLPKLMPFLRRHCPPRTLLSFGYMDGWPLFLT